MNSSVIESLEHFYNATNGANWHWSNGSRGSHWNFTKSTFGSYIYNPCENWQGICCKSGVLKPNISIQCFSNVKILNVSAILDCGECIVAIMLPRFELRGYIPDSFFNLTTIQMLDLSDNIHLAGTLPQTLSRMENLMNLKLNANALDGTMPILSALTSLVIFEIADNRIEGSIPDIFSLTSLIFFNLYNNIMTGTIPELAGLSSLQNLGLYNNMIEGTIPSLSSLNALNGLALYNNLLTGIIPALSELTNLEYLGINNNYLDGTVPELRGLVSIAYLILDQNLLTGSVPQWNMLKSMEFIIMHNNLLSGFVPTVLEMDFLQELSLEFNNFTGPLPSLTGVSAMVELYLGSNQFTGTIATSIYELTALASLYLNGNNLIGSLASTISNLSKLTIINLQNNQFSGRLPKSLSSLSLLNTLLIHDNLFDGPPDNCFPSALASVDISDNNFSGSIPSYIVMLPNISHISMIKNCFTGSLSEALCSCSSSLKSLALDGLTSGTGCRKPLLGDFTDTFTVKWYVHSSIPSCLFQLTSLEALQLSGNGLSGSLPSNADFTIGSNLRNLSLSHNRLTGSIPILFQNHPFESLDLSYNKISGTLSGINLFYTRQQIQTQHPFNHSFDPLISTTSRKQLILQVNRLSGVISNSFREVQNIAVMNGNLFDCASVADMPLHDPGTAQAQCGSSDLNIGLSMWVSFFGLICLAAIMVVLKRNLNWCTMNITTNAYELMLKSINQYHLFCQSAVQYSEKNVLKFTSILRKLESISVTGAGAAVLVCLWITLTLKYLQQESYSTHRYQYAYTPSLAFLSGDVPAALLLVGVLSMMTILWLFIHLNKDPAQSISLISHHQRDDNNAKMTVKEASLWGVVIAVDIVVMVAANAGYLFVALQYSNSARYATLVALVTFKLGWNYNVLPVLVNAVEACTSRRNSSSVVLVALILFNNILAPLITTICNQPECFYNVFVSADDIQATATYTTTVSDTYNGQQYYFQFPLFDDISFQPPFIYSYQCSSALVTYYVPMFVVMFTYLGFGAPMVSIMTVRILSTTQTPWIKLLIGYSAYDIAKPVVFLDSRYPRYHNPSSRDADADEAVQYKQALELLDTRQVGAALVCHVATLMTFGVACPLLAVLIAYALCVEVRMWLALVGRYYQHALLDKNASIVGVNGNSPMEQQRFAVMSKRLQLSCAGVENILYLSRWILLAGIAMFFAMFLLDMAGDKAKNSLARTLWAPLTVLLWPVCLFLFEIIVLWSHPIEVAKNNDASNLELSMVSNNPMMRACEINLNEKFV